MALKNLSRREITLCTSIDINLSLFRQLFEQKTKKSRYTRSSLYEGWDGRKTLRNRVQSHKCVITSSFRYFFLQQCVTPHPFVSIFPDILVLWMSFETSFDSKQPKLEPKLVSALSEAKRLFRLFRFYTETESFDVSIEPKQTKDPPKQFEREYIWVFFRKFRIVSVCHETVMFVSVVSI